jgi:hypothetical protein
MTDAKDTDNEPGLDEEVDEFADPELDDVLDEDELAEDDLEDIDEDALATDDDFVDDAEDTLVVGAEEEAAPEAPPRPRRAAGEEKEEEDEEELDPDDVEADLDTILKDRLEAYDENGEDEEEEEVATTVGAEEGDLPQKKEGEFPCPSCFLLVSAKQVARTGYCPHCGDPISVPAGL